MNHKWEREERNIDYKDFGLITNELQIVGDSRNENDGHFESLKSMNDPSEISNLSTKPSLFNVEYKKRSINVNYYAY